VTKDLTKTEINRLWWNQRWPCMVEREDGVWTQPDGWLKMPLSFSVRATKPI
jgi:hypothetical protein